MKILDVLYYNYYMFANRNQPITDPHITVVMTLSFSESLMVNYAIDIISAHFFCQFIMNMWGMLVVLAALLSLNFLIYIKGERGNLVVRTEPFFVSKKASKLATIFFIALTTSLLFWAADYGMYLIKDCN